jgi:hypothetical protein
MAAAATLLPATAKAETCAQLRPDWTAATGPQTGWAETAYILGSPPSLALATLLLLALAFPRLWLAIPATLLTLAFAALLIVSRQAPMAIAAQTEGCLATATPAIAILTLTAILTLARALYARRR